MADYSKLIDKLKATIDAQEAELATLRLIVTEKFAETSAHLIVKPEDAVDVAKWAQHPGAVRELLRHMPARVDEDDYVRCGSCDEVNLGVAHAPDCAIAAAWRALGDPRGAADLERAHEEALRQNQRPGIVAAHVERIVGAQGQRFRMFNFVQVGRAHPFGVAPRDVAAGERFEIRTQHLAIEVEAGEDLRAGAMLQAVSEPVDPAPFRLAAESQVNCTCPPTLPGFPRPLGVHSAYCALTRK